MLPHYLTCHSISFLKFAYPAPVNLDLLNMPEQAHIIILRFKATVIIHLGEWQGKDVVVKEGSMCV